MGVRISDDVQRAVQAGQPVVALESTIISHGMPYPQNVEMAHDVEAIVRRQGATPATIAVIDGVCTVGVDAAGIESLASRADVYKATTRDLPWLVATKSTGATTVAATMHLAALAGIRVFATGGIGGVHRGAATTFDISADLTELASTPVAVVCAGVKSILDIALTLEYLETAGVPVVVLGSDQFPAFYSRSSGYPAPRRVDDAEHAAAVLDATWTELELQRGICVANPISQEDEIPASEIDSVIAEALTELTTQGIVGQAVTPFLLSRIVDQTGGRSLQRQRFAGQAQRRDRRRHRRRVRTTIAIVAQTSTVAANVAKVASMVWRLRPDRSRTPTTRLAIGADHRGPMIGPGLDDQRLATIGLEPVVPVGDRERAERDIERELARQGGRQSPRRRYSTSPTLSCSSP